MDKVVIVDDEIWVTEVIKNIVSWKSYEFEIAAVCHDGVEAVRSICEIQPALVLTDIRMPGKNGIELLKEISEHSKNTMVAVISGFNDFEYAKSALTYGAIGYLLKPINENELEDVLEKVRKTIDSRKKNASESRKMQADYIATIDTLRSGFFERVFTDSQAPVPDLEETNARLKMKWKEGAFRVVSVAFHHQGLDHIDKVDESIWASQLPVVCHDILTLSYRDRYYILINYSEVNTEKVAERLKNAAKDFFTICPDSVFYLGEPFTDIRGLGQACQKLSFMEYLRLFMGYGRIYDQSSFTFMEQKVQKLFQPMLELVFRQNMSKGEEDELEKNIAISFEGMLQRTGNNAIAFAEGVFALAEKLMHAAIETGVDNGQTITELKYRLSVQDDSEAVKNVLLDIVSEFSFPSAADQMSRTDKSVVEEATEYIQNYYMNNISLADLAERVHLNQSYLSDLFKRENGVSFKDYLTGVRIGKAKELLKNSDYKLAEIAVRTGYNDVKNFSKIFKKTIGITPMEFRKLMG